ncbi:MAG TPA: hypothetical protein VGM73_11935 [Candidatus Didemnitutus sp.]|jgi:hypothetical protein
MKSNLPAAPSPWIRLGFTRGTAADFRAALRRGGVLPDTNRASDGGLGSLWDATLVDRLRAPVTRHPY